MLQPLSGLDIPPHLPVLMLDTSVQDIYISEKKILSNLFNSKHCASIHLILSNTN